LLWRGDRDRIRAHAASYSADDPRLIYLARPAREVALTGRLDGPEVAWLDATIAAKGGSVRQLPFLNQFKAELACYVGDLGPAWAALAAAVDAGLTDLVWLDRCPALAPLRAEPRFAALRARVDERVRPVVKAFLA
jgi:serine/threonine-protein kinase